jgi:4-amino-4-deoxy-L-arabinose transferase-like glycosyltransferase
MSDPQVASRRTHGRDAALIVLAALACLLAFVDKPLHLDDPVYVRIARQIVDAPHDFFGLEMNWHGRLEPVAAFNKNPPGVSFWLAAAGSLVGWSERALHVWMLAPALALLLATWRLAARFSGSPRMAALALLAMPGFLVSATTLMADVGMLALWCWALVLWTGGLERRRVAALVAAGVLAALCAVTKYVGVAVIPLLAAYALAKERRWWGWLACLAVPVAALLGFDLAMRAAYGVSPFSHVSAYALSYRPQPVPLESRTLVGLSFLGGCLLPGIFFAPWLWRGRTLVAGLAGLGLLGLAAARFGRLESLSALGEGGWLLRVQLAVFVATGVQCLVLAVADLRARRDAASLLLALWLAGIFGFATFANWSTNARAVLAAAPAAALLLVRRLETRGGIGWGDARPLRLAPLAPALAVALAVAWADARLAESARQAALELTRKYAVDGRQPWFRGAWGFQHYAELEGARKIDESDTLLAPGDVVFLPTNNSGVGPLPPQVVTALERAEFPAARWVASMAAPLGAGFYSDLWGPLPFAFGRAPAEVYWVLRVERPLRIQAGPGG